MDQRVPDNYFRPTRESEDVRGDDGPGVPPGTAAVRTVASSEIHDGWTPRAVATLAVVALALAFTVGRLWVFPPHIEVQQVPSAALSSAPVSPSVSPDPVAPFDGAVVTVQALDAEGRCTAGGSREAALALIDNNPDTLWRCRGNGEGESVTITLPGPRTLVGLRVINGNTVWNDRYVAERRITTIRWTFSDGSFFEQGLAPNDRNPQEVRFPEVDTSTVTFTVLATTSPGGAGPSVDAVSIGLLEFLGPA